MADAEDFMGKRIALKGSIGTIRYYGEVQPRSGLWFGVDWDDPSRGRNDGTYAGVRYFEARTLTSGSFIRPVNVEFGVSFLTALKNKYGDVSGNNGIDVENLTCLLKEFNVRFVEMVGMDKVVAHCLGQLEVVILRNHYISSGDPKEEILKVCPAIRELDMSLNLIPTWDIVAEIVSALPNLRILNISENRLPMPPTVACLTDAFESLTHLVLAKMGYTWDDVEPVFRMSPHLTHLQVPWNNITRLSRPPLFVRLHAIDLSGNPIKDWEEINKLGNISSLQVLNCARTLVKEIRFPDEVNRPTTLFQSLEKLYIQDTLIYEYQSIDELNRIERLEVLRITKCPVLNLFDSDTTRQLLIAKIAGLKVLNGKDIKNNERKSAEIDYVKIALVEKISHTLPDQLFRLIHPRYYVLVEKYGIPEFESLDFDTRPPLTQVLLYVTFVCPDRPGLKIQRKVPKTMTIKRLRTILDRFFKFERPQLIQLWLVTDMDPTGEIKLANDSMYLDYYHVKTGDTIIAREVSPLELFNERNMNF